MTKCGQNLLINSKGHNMTKCGTEYCFVIVNLMHTTKKVSEGQCVTKACRRRQLIDVSVLNFIIFFSKITNGGSNLSGTTFSLSGM